MKLYFKPILLASGDWSAEGSGEGEFRRRRIANPFASSDISPLEINSVGNSGLQSVELPVSDGLDDVSAPEVAPAIELEPIIDIFAPIDLGN